MKKTRITPPTLKILLIVLPGRCWRIIIGQICARRIYLDETMNEMIRINVEDDD